MNLIIESPLSAPPSDVTCFRDVTLYSKTFIFEDILLRCDYGTRSFYWKWLKRNGAHDFISQLIRRHEKEPGFCMSPTNGNLNVKKIDAFNLGFILSSLNGQKRGP